jgi:hypothetical protein
MRKRIIGQEGGSHEVRSDERWLDLEHVAEVEVTSENANFPIESAFTFEREGGGWRAAEPGKQLVRIVFDPPVALHQIRLRFVENLTVRTQEFVLRWAAKRDQSTMRDIVRQQWNFSPDGATTEIENYQVDLDRVGVLELEINPDISGGGALASLAEWRVA